MDTANPIVKMTENTNIENGARMHEITTFNCMIENDRTRRYRYCMVECHTFYGRWVGGYIHVGSYSVQLSEIIICGGVAAYPAGAAGLHSLQQRCS